MLMAMGTERGVVRKLLGCARFSVSGTGSQKVLLGSTALSAALALSLALAPVAADAQSFRFSNVRVEGNQRIQSSTIVAYTGLSQGEAVTGGQLNDAYRGVFDSGLFKSVELVPQGNTLVIKVVEFPTISRISFEGNRRIKDDTLSEVVEIRPPPCFQPRSGRKGRRSDCRSLSGAGSSRVDGDAAHHPAQRKPRGSGL